MSVVVHSGKHDPMQRLAKVGFQNLRLKCWGASHPFADSRCVRLPSGAIFVDVKPKHGVVGGRQVGMPMLHNGTHST